MARIGNRQSIWKEGAAPLNLRQVRLQLRKLTRIKQFNVDPECLPQAHVPPTRLIASFIVKYVQAAFILYEMPRFKVGRQTLPTSPSVQGERGYGPHIVRGVCRKRLPSKLRKPGQQGRHSALTNAKRTLSIKQQARQLL